MRQFLFLTASLSVLALAGCSATTAKPETDATAAAITASDKESAEMEGVMKGEAPVVDVADKDIPADPQAEIAESADMTAPTTKTTLANAPKDCPVVEVLPDTKSITYFDDPEGKPNGKLISNAVLVDIRGGCDYAENSVSVDIDMIMKGKITNKGRYEGRDDLEAFMTFPYFVAIMAPDGKLIDKKIMATAMRFKPKIDDLDHAEKITQVIPLTDLAQGPKYTIAIGFQLNRAQLDYNRGGAPDVKKNKKQKVEAPQKEETVNEEAAKEAPKKEEPAKAEKPDTPDTSESDAPTAAPATTAPAPAAVTPAGSKMKPVLE